MKIVSPEYTLDSYPGLFRPTGPNGSKRAPGGTAPGGRTPGIPNDGSNPERGNPARNGSTIIPPALPLEKINQEMKVKVQ